MGAPGAAPHLPPQRGLRLPSPRSSFPRASPWTWACLPSCLTPGPPFCVPAGRSEACVSQGPATMDSVAAGGTQPCPFQLRVPGPVAHPPLHQARLQKGPPRGGRVSGEVLGGNSEGQFCSPSQRPCPPCPCPLGDWFPWGGSTRPPALAGRTALPPRARARWVPGTESLQCPHASPTPTGGLGGAAGGGPSDPSSPDQGGVSPAPGSVRPPLRTSRNNLEIGQFPVALEVALSPAGVRVRPRAGLGWGAAGGWAVGPR